MSSSDRRPYLTATSIDQALLDACADNLECKLEMVVEIETPGGGTIYASDRNKYVVLPDGTGTFYEALLNFPEIGRTVGEWLSNDLQFSTQTLELSNVDGRFNEFLPGGASFAGWINKAVVIKLGLAEIAATYFTIFKGSVTDSGGFKRSVKSISVVARDDFDAINQTFPTGTFQESSYPKIEPKNIGKVVPVIYGDWTLATEPAPASVPAYVVNGNDPLVTFKDRTAEISGPASPGVVTLTDHDFDANDMIEFTTDGTLPAPLATDTTYYVILVDQDNFRVSASFGGPAIATTSSGSGQHKVKPAQDVPPGPPRPSASRRNVQLVIAINDLTELDEIYLKRGDTYYEVTAGVVVGAGLKSLTIAQGGTWVDGGPFEFDQSDLFFVRCKGKDLSGYDDNLVWQARDILMAYGGALSGDFDANWATLRDKAVITATKGRAWIGESQKSLTYALSLLEQVKLEAFISRELNIKLNSLHFDDWNSSPSYTVKNWDVVRDSFQTSIDERNNFNVAQGVYNYLPDVNENAYQTAWYRNPDAISQTRRIAKKVVFPNLYLQADAIYWTGEILKLASSILEVVTTSLTWRAALLDIGSFVLIDVQIGSTIFENVPAMIRDFGYDPSGLQIKVRLWSMQMVPYPGYTPGYPGTVGGYSATIELDV